MKPKSKILPIKIFLNLFLIILPFLLCIPLLLYLSDNTLVLFPNPRYLSQTESFVSLNSSITNININSMTLSFSFILRPRPNDDPYPYASIVIWLTRENTFFDLSGYDYLFLEIGKSTRERVTVFIKTFVTGISKPEKQEALSLRHNEYTLSLTPGVSRYKIKIQDFLTPDWWFTLLNVPVEKRGKESFTRVSALDLQIFRRDTAPSPEKTDEFVATKIAFQKHYPAIYLVLNAAAAIYTVLLIIALFNKRKRRTAPGSNAPFPAEIQYKRRALDNYADNELDRVMKHLEEHYNEPNISSSSISRETGIPRSHIAELVNERYNCTCKQLINRIRITEAKRLLKATDRRILEIALEVGFEDISTFNRCFKQEEGITPRQFRSR